MGKYRLNTTFIQSEMQKHGLNEEQLAEKMGVSVKRLKKYLYGEYKVIPYAIFYNILRVLKVSLEDIIVCT